MKIENCKFKTSQGQSLIEILVAVTVAAMVFVPLVALLITSQRATLGARDATYAQSLITDMSSAVRSLATQDWHSLWGSSGLVGYWAMDEGASTSTLDPVNGNNGNIIIGPSGTQTNVSQAWQTSANCKAGRCLNFDGTDDYLTISNNIDYSSNAFTVSAWINSNDVTSCRHSIVSSKEDQSSGFVLAQPEGNCNHIRLWANISGIWQFVDTAGTISTGTWYHVAGTYNGTTLTVYLNGSPTSATFSGTLSNTSGPTTIGARNSNNTNWFNGKIDEVRVYNRALSATEIAGLYTNKFYPQNIGGLWSLKEGQDQISSGPTTFLRGFNIVGVQRDINNNIVASGGTDDPSTKLITYSVEVRPAGASSGNIVSTSEYITRSQSNIFLQTDWSGGPGASGTVTLGTNQFSTSASLYTSSTGRFRLKLTTE